MIGVKLFIFSNFFFTVGEIQRCAGRPLSAGEPAHHRRDRPHKVRHHRRQGLKNYSLRETGVRQMLLFFPLGRIGHLDDLHHRAADRVRWHRADLHRPQVPQRQGRRLGPHEVNKKTRIIENRCRCYHTHHCPARTKLLDIFLFLNIFYNIFFRHPRHNYEGNEDGVRERKNERSYTLFALTTTREREK